ncbi:hypothetical protein [Sediminibacillus sp. JSM 1682029]|uniref:hypothetical protein n=1 Tax=Sediminibacillus sp. JSM 1682029 TaxID=3229857 RepID=UPI0035262647
MNNSGGTTSDHVNQKEHFLNAFTEIAKKAMKEYDRKNQKVEDAEVKRVKIPTYNKEEQL